MSKQYHDRFSDATEELQNKSGFICESCNQKYDHKEAKEKGNTCCGRTMKELVEESFGP